MYRPYFMMKSIGEDYYLECRGPGFRLDDRELETDDIERFETWISAYRRALPKNDPAEEMLSLGREIFGWLDRDDNWFSALKANRKVGDVVSLLLYDFDSGICSIMPRQTRID